MINSEDEIKNCKRGHHSHDRPKVANEPALRLKATFYGDSHDKRKAEQAWLVLAWNKERPDSINVWGPFRTRTIATAFGRRHFPRRYHVSGMFDPNKIDWYWH